MANRTAPFFSPTGDGSAADPAQTALSAALDELAATQRAIDAVHARRARQASELLRLAERVEIAEGASATRAAEFAHRSLRAELALALRMSEYAADRLLSEARTLAALPMTLAAVERGDIAWRAAQLIAEQARDISASSPEESRAARLAGFEAAALRIAAVVAPSRLRNRLAVLRERVHAVPSVERHRSARAERHVTLADAEDGMSWLNAYLPSVEAHAVFHRLTDVARALVEPPAESALAGPDAVFDELDDQRTLEQRRADLLVDFVAGDHVMLDGVAGHERRVARGLDLGRFAGIRPTVVVTVPVQTLLEGDSDGTAEPAMLDGVVPIDAVTARRLTAGAPGLYRMLTDPHSGVRLDLGRRRYEVSTELRMWLRLRDEHCRFPGCGRLAKGCDVDHGLDWQYGGETRADNLAHLCRGHHTLKHRTAWRMIQHPDGTITWRSPSGRQHSTRPSHAFARAA